MNNKEDITEQYEAWASTYDLDKVEMIRKDTGIELEEFVNHILDNCQLKKGQEILDVGIGTGLISVSISKRLSGNCKILGIDITDAMLTKAKNNIKMESLVPATTISIIDDSSCLKEGFVTNSPSIFPMRTAPIGPKNGTSDKERAAEAAIVPKISASFSLSADNTKIIT